MTVFVQVLQYTLRFYIIFKMHTVDSKYAQKYNINKPFEFKKKHNKTF